VTRESFPRQHARTRGFTLGRPRNFTVSTDGTRVCFLRSRAGGDPVTCLWSLEVETGIERLVADPRQLGAADVSALPAEERARRERARETAGGVVAFAGDDNLRTIAFALAGQLFRAVIDGDRVDVEPLDWPGPVFDPRPDPSGARVAYVRDGALHVDGEMVAGDDDPAVTWGVAEFVAAEELGRSRGYWWAPEGNRLAVARVDNSPVLRWHVADPADPAAPPVELAYPAAGTANADVQLHLVTLEGGRTQIQWDREGFPYLGRVVWPDGRPLTLLVQSRDQRTVQVLASADDGSTTLLQEHCDPAWVDLVEGVPAWTADGALVTVAGVGGAHRVLFDGEPVTPPGLQVRRVVSVAGEVLFTASADDPTEVHVHCLTDGVVERVSDGPGVHGAAGAGSTRVIVSLTPDGFGCRVGDHEIASFEETPDVDPQVAISVVGERALRAAVLYPADHRPGAKLPVLLDPYGGPHVQRVLRTRAAFLTSQWLADQGFAVVVVDGRGTPGRGPEWEREVLGDLATPVLDDQVDALHALAAEHPDLDLSRVAIRGWSFGGFLAALAVLRRPDVFHAAVAGAPVTDWRLYDTHYTERYLGHPAEHPGHYRVSSLLDDAPNLERPLLLVHGLADDNVVAAHTLQLSRALLEAGRPHTVLPLSGVTHMTPQEVVAENLLLLQVDFLKRSLKP
jgi:dipeptidyl-peptidase 4